ncbi:MAG: GTPase [Cyanobacteriota bacterium]|nr:GTPase [Cyanobacteriota bacterium]
MNRKELLTALESALVAEDWQYVGQLQGVLLELGDPESLAQMESILKKAKDLQSQPPVEANGSQVDNLNQGNINSPKPPTINLSDPLPKPRLALQMRDESQIIQSDPSSFSQVYKLPLNEEMKDTKRMISKCHVGQPIFPQRLEKVLMVVGATGAGKSTLINGMVNYILGVEWKDDFRFKLIGDEGGKSQAHSQTKLITSYTIHKMEDSPLPYTLTIVDTPGFGDTGGLKRDEFITNQIREFFSIPNGISHIDGIGFVTQSSLARLTPTQQYIFDAILSIFGKDIASNIFMMVTFADGQKPPVLEAIKAAKVPYSDSFKFNNSALFAENAIDEDDEDDEDENFDEMFWKMGFKSFKKFFTEFQKKDSISLQMTKDVLTERRELEVTVNGLLPQIKEAQLKLDQFLREEAVLIKFKDQIKANKDFTWTDTETKQRKVDTPKGQYVTNCLICNRTCHEECGIPDDREKYNCWAMNNRGNSTTAVCRFCHCFWKKHVNNPYRFELYQEKVTKTYDNIKKRYEEAKKGKTKVEDVIKSLNAELEEVCEEIFLMIQKTQKCLHRLDEIALKRNPLTQVQYIDLLIESEKREAKFGWEERVKYYKSARDFAITLLRTKDAASIERKGNIKEWAKELISKLKRDKIQQLEVSVGKKKDANPLSWFEDMKNEVLKPWFDNPK